MLRIVATFAFLSSLLSGTTALVIADEGERQSFDHERAREALEAGEIVPLSEILREVEMRYDSTVIEVELDHRDERWVYGIEVLTTDGRLLEIYLDAKTKAEIAVERK